MMASSAPDFAKASAHLVSAVLAILPAYPRPVIEQLVEKMIDRLDHEDGDPDSELNGDENDGSGPEEDAWFEPGAFGFFMEPQRLPGTPEDAEDGNDAESETWSHADDHPFDFFIGRRTPARQLGDE